MSYGKHGRKVLSLWLLAAFSTMAVLASAAQAQEFTIGGKTLKALSIESETLTGKTEGSVAFLIPSLGIQLVCEEATISGHILQSGLGQQTMEITGCTVQDSKGNPNETCEVAPIVAKFSTSLVSHAGEWWVLFKSPNGEPFTTILFLDVEELELECSLEEQNPLTGAFIALMGSDSVSQLLTFETNGSIAKLFKELGIYLNYAFGAAEAFLEINVLLELSGKYKGEEWGAI